MPDEARSGVAVRVSLRPSQESGIVGNELNVMDKLVQAGSR